MNFARDPFTTRQSLKFKCDNSNFALQNGQNADSEINQCSFQPNSEAARKSTEISNGMFAYSEELNLTNIWSSNTLHVNVNQPISNALPIGIESTQMDGNLLAAID